MNTQTAPSAALNAAAERRPRMPSPLPYFLAALTLVAILPIALPETGLIAMPWNWSGALPFAAGLALMLWADGQFKRAGTVKPFSRASVLVTDGAFTVSRHPMYLGMTAMLVGLALLLGNPVALAVPVIFGWRVRQVFMLPEEWQLESQFGGAYREYKQSVARWVSLPLG